MGCLCLKLAAEVLIAQLVAAGIGANTRSPVGLWFHNVTEGQTVRPSLANVVTTATMVPAFANEGVPCADELPHCDACDNVQY